MEQQSKQVLSRAISYAMETRSMILGAVLHADEMESGRMTFCVRRKEDSKPGDGALIIGEFLDMADAADIEVVIDVEAGEPRLLRYYRDFGFTLVEGEWEREEAEIRAIEAERTAWVSKGRDLRDMGVVTMGRNRWAGALLPQTELDEVMQGAPLPRSERERSAQHRDAVLIALQKRGMTARQAGCRVSPTLSDHEVCIRTAIRRRHGWNVPSFRQSEKKAA